ncbi:hypothetical protein V6N13_142955 [Hibiscus sabdariffa]
MQISNVGDLAPRFHAISQYKRGRTSEAYDWHNRETYNSERSVLGRFQDIHFGLKDKRYSPNVRERMYKFELVASWVFFLVVFMLDYRVKIAEDACCKRSVFGKGLDFRVAYSSTAMQGRHF